VIAKGSYCYGRAVGACHVSWTGSEKFTFDVLLKRCSLHVFHCTYAHVVGIASVGAFRPRGVSCFFFLSSLWGFWEYSDACILPLACMCYLLLPSCLSYPSLILLCLLLASFSLDYLFPPHVSSLSTRSVAARIFGLMLSAANCTFCLFLSLSFVFLCMIVPFLAPLSLAYVFDFL
jgi:hypothetical protein